MRSKAAFSGEFWLLSAASMLVGTYGILLLAMTLRFGNDAGYPGALPGLLSSVFAFASLAIRPFSGLLCDRFSQKRLLCLSGVGFAILSPVFLTGASYPILLVIRILEGAGLAVASTAAGAMATARIPKEHFTRGIGYYGIGMAASSAIAPGLGLWLFKHWGYPGVFWFAAGIGVAIVLLVLPVRQPPAPVGRPCSGSVWRGMYEPRALFATAITLGLCIAQITVMQLLPYAAAERGGADTERFYFVSALAVIAARLTAGALRERTSERVLTIVGFGLLFAGYLGLQFLPPAAFVLLLMALCYGLGHSFSSVMLNALAVDRVPPERLGAANATYLAASDLGYAVGPILWSAWCGRNGYGYVFLIAAFLAICLFLLVFARDRLKHTIL